MTTCLARTIAVIFTLHKLMAVSGFQSNDETLFRLPEMDSDLLEIYNGDHFVDLTTYIDGTFRLPTVLVLYSGWCKQQAESLGMFDINNLPPPTYLNYARHDYETWKKNSWFRFSNRQDLGTFHNVTSCPAALFWPESSSSESEPARWSEGHPASFRQWLSEKLVRSVTLKNGLNHTVKFILQTEIGVNTVVVEPGLQQEVRVTPMWAKPVVAKCHQSDEILQAWIVSQNGQLLHASNQSAFSYLIWLAETQSHLEQLWKWTLEFRTSHAQRHQRVMQQPPQMARLTNDGYKHLRMPAALHHQLLCFYRNTSSSDYEQHSPSFVVSQTIFNDDEAKMEKMFLPEDASETMARQLKPLVEEWCGCKIVRRATSSIPFRRYSKGSRIRMHVDEFGLGKRAEWLGVLLQIDQDLQGAPDWNFTVIGLDGEWHSFSTSPGDMVFFESRAVPHGRPEALQGESFANAFVFYLAARHESGDLSGGSKAKKDEL